MAEHFDDYDGRFPENNVMMGVCLIAEYLDTVPVTPDRKMRLIRTIDVDTLLAYNITLDVVIRLRDMGWYIKDDCLVVGG